ncbi:MAG: right-handed parallel beta-helix repeat-containing protein [Saprospiraceae bacterium]|nr:right-handed parallel beta-helix repeat-containing protein [Saprospiraceae bacterium]
MGNIYAIQYQLSSVNKSSVKINNNCVDNVGNNTITNNSLGGIGINDSGATGVLTGLEVKDNSISNIEMSNAAWPTGKIAYGIILNVAGGTTGNILGAEILNNTIELLSAHISTGIAMEGNTENAVVKGNTVSTLSGTKTGTRSGGGYDLQALKFESNKWVSTVTVEENNFNADGFTHSDPNGVGYAIANYVTVADGGALTTSCNWHGESLFADIEDNATFTGRIFNKDMCETTFITFWESQNSIVCEGVGPVENLSTNITYATIQEAIDAATAGDILELSAHTFTERVVVDKSLTIQGKTTSKTLYVIDGTDEVGNGDGIFIQNGVTNVSIKNVTVQNFAGATGNSDAGIYAVGGNNDLNVDNVAILDNAGGSGFYANGPVNGVTINDCMVSGHTSGARGIVIWNGLKENIVITNNTVSNNNCCGIELQDGNANLVTITGNTVTVTTGDSGMGLTGMSNALVDNNIINGAGRFGIEIKNPNGNVSVTNNQVTNTGASNNRDYAGIAVFRRVVLAGNADIPNGVTLTGNTVTGYTHLGPVAEGFGIVVEGTNHIINNNTLNGNDIGIQLQGAGHINANYPGGDGDQVAGQSPNYFGRGNTPIICDIDLGANTFSGSGTEYRLSTNDISSTTTPRVTTDLTEINQYLDNEIGFTINGVAAGNTNNGSIDVAEDIDIGVCSGDNNVVFSLISPDLENIVMSVDYSSSNLDSPPISYLARVTDFNDQIATLGTLSLNLDNPAISGSLTITITTFNDANDNGVLDIYECTGDLILATIMVKPNPDVVDPIDQIKCDGEMSDEVVFATTLGIPGTMYSWVNDTPAIGIAASGTSATLPATVLSNTSENPITATITVTPIVDGCEGSSESFTIRVLDSYPAEIICPDDITVDNELGLCEAVVNFDLPMAYDQVFFDGFENGIATDWISFNSQITTTPSGAIPSSSGANYGDINTTVDAQTGMFTRLGGYNSTFGDGFRTSLDVFMDLNDPAVIADTYGWDLSSAVNNQSGGHRRDFIFHTANDVAGNILVGGSNNTNFSRREDIATLNHYTITSTGWYTFEFVYRDAGDGSLAVDLNLLDAAGNSLWTETRNTPSDVIATEIGGNRYMWFTFIATDNLAIDNTTRANTLFATASPVSGSSFPVGSTTVTVTSDIDECGVAATCTFEVIVNDTEQPEYEDCPSDFMICKSLDDMYNWTHVKLVDNCALGTGMTELTYSLSGATMSGPVAVTSFDGSTMANEMLNVGMTTVTYSAKDAAGNLVDGVCSFTITVQALPVSEITADYAVWINSDSHLASVADAGVGASYTWSISGDAMITSGDGTTEITFESGTDPSIDISVTVVDGNTCESMSTTTVKVIDPCDLIDFSEELELSIGTMPGVGLWSVDRFAPHVFEAMATAPDGTLNTLHVGIDAADGQSNGFYNTQGRKYQHHPTTVETEIDLYVDASWAATGRRMAGFWCTALDISDAISAYPIIEFTSDGGTPRFRGWESDGTWYDMGLPAGFVYDSWVTLRIQLLSTGEFRYTVETAQGNLMYNTTTHGVYGSTHLDNTIIQAHNTTAGVTYDVYWDDLNGSPLSFSLLANSTEQYHLDTLVYCDTDMVEFVISGNVGDTYEIELNGSSVSSGAVNDAGYSFIASPTTEGTYSITVTNSDGCMLTETYEMKVNLLPESIALSQEEACSGVEYTLALDAYLTSLIGSSTFAWEITDITPLPTVIGVSVGDTGNGDITHTVTNPYTIVETIEYTITPTSIDGCEGLPFVVNVKINANPQVAINMNGPSELCQGEVRNPLGFVLPTGSYSYDWKIVSASFGNATITNTSTLNPELTAQTDNENDLTIRFIATNTTTGCQDSTEVTFTVGAVPSFSSGEPLDLVLCEGTEGGGTAIFDLNDAITSVSPVTAAVTYHTSASDASNGVGALGSPESYTAVDGEMIFVRLENNGCFITGDFMLTVNPLPIVTIDPVPVLCALGDPVALNASPSGGTYSGPGVVGSNFDPELAGAGSHTITYTVSVDGCTNSGSIVIVVNASEDIVMNNNNSGVGSLRYVIANTCAGDTVFFDSGLLGSTITLTGGEIDINSFKVIKGLGDNVLTVSGNDLSRIFNVQSGVNFHVKDIKLINGSEATDGGAILNNGSLILENLTLEGNKENGIPKALTNNTGASLIFRGDVIINN